MPTVLPIAFLALASAAQPAKQPKETTRPWVELAGGPAFPFARGPVWLRSQLRLGLPLMRLDERLELSLVLPLGAGWARQQGAISSTRTELALELIPSARLGARGPGRLRFYGDFGAGVTHFRYGFELPGLDRATATSTGLGLRLGAGLDYELSRQWRLFLEPLHILFHTAQEGVFRYGNSSFTSSTGAGTQASVLAGASFTW
ncbi:MAG TPA: hypothetical protein VLQ93_18005 [Myxococcaceae bacterium]|nr:hypothetical protein [Myxococcaceae bacterium]